MKISKQLGMVNKKMKICSIQAFESRCVFLQAENLLKAADNPFGGKECLAASLKEQSLKP